MEVFKLFGSILVDSDEATKSIDKTDSKAQKTASTLGNGVKTAAKWGAAITTAAVGAGTAVVGLANKSAEYADTFDKASLRTGLGVEYLQKLNYAAGQSGVELTAIEKSAKTLNSRMGEVSEGNENSIAMFEKLGVAVTNSDGSLRNSDEVYNDVINKLADMGDTAEATAIGTDLFGGAFTKVKPLLAAGSGGIKELTDNADKLGIVMSKDAVSAGVKFGDTIADIKTAFTGMANNLGASAIPLLQKFADLIIDNMPTIQGMVDKLVPIIVEIIDTVLPPFMDLADALLPIILDLITALLPVISDIASKVLPIIVQLIEKLAPVFLEIVEQLLPPLLDILDALMPILDIVLQVLDPILSIITAILPTLSGLLEAIAPLITLILDLISNCLEPLQPIIEIIAGLFSGSLNNAITNVTAVIDTLTSVLDGIMTFIEGVFTGDWEKAWSGIESIFTGVWEGLQGIADNVINGIIGGINGFIDMANQIPGVDIPKIGGSITAESTEVSANSAIAGGIATVQPPKMASGGLAYGESNIIVGEYAGASSNPEVIAPLDKLAAILQTAIDGSISKLADAITRGASQPITIIVQLKSGLEIARVFVDDINRLSRVEGGCVINV